jgi:aspartate aminotransferase
MIKAAKYLDNVGFSATLKSKELINRMKAEGKEVLAFTVGEPDFDTPKYITEAAIEALNNGFTHYTASSGIPELRNAIAEKSVNENKIPCRPDNVLVTPCKFGIYSSILAAVNPGDEVIISDPAWVSYEPMVQMAEGKAVFVKTYNEDEFRMIPENVMEKVTDKTKMIILNSPSNPTGGVATQGDVKGIADIAKDHDLIVLSDEIYEKIIYEGIHYSIAAEEGMAERTFTVNGFSKAYAMTGWRLGWVIAPEILFDAISKIQQHSISCCTSFAQKGGVAALKCSSEVVNEMVQKFKARRDLVINGINEIPGLSCFMPKGAFYAFIKLNYNIHSEEFCNRLIENAGVVLTPGSAFGTGGEGFIRLSYAASQEMLNKGLNKIAEFVKSIE